MKKQPNWIGRNGVMSGYRRHPEFLGKMVENMPEMSKCRIFNTFHRISFEESKGFSVENCGDIYLR